MDELPRKITAQPTEILALGTDPGRTRIEYLPIIWDAAEAFTSTNLETRCEGLQRLLDGEAVRNHSLVAYLLFTRLSEPDIELRTRIVCALADVMIPDGSVEPDTRPAYSGLFAWLSEMRTRQIYCLLQVTEFDKTVEHYVAALLEGCSYAGEHLAEILSNRQMPLSIRQQAAYFIGRMGYIDALPVMERMATKLEQRRNGREDLGERAPESDECSLLPLIHSALTVLTAP